MQEKENLFAQVTVKMHTEQVCMQCINQPKIVFITPKQIKHPNLFQSRVRLQFVISNMNYLVLL